MLNILMVTSLFPNPGSPKKGIFVYNMVRSLENKVRFTVVVPVPQLLFNHKIIIKEDLESFTEELLSKLPHVDAIYYVSYPFLPKVFHPLFSGWLYYRLKKLVACLINQRNFDLIHAHFLFPEGVIAAKLGAEFSVKSLCTAHGSDVNIIASRLYWKPFLTYALRRLSGLIFVSRALYERFLSTVGNGVDVKDLKLVVIPNGFADWVSPCGGPEDEQIIKMLQSEGKKIILFVGNLINTKRPDILLEALGHVKVEECNAVLIIIGKGPKEVEVKVKAKQFNLLEGKDLISLGEVRHEKVLFWMKEADLLVLTSENEGLPGVVLESLSLGTPVVATAVGGVPEVVLDGVNGFLCQKNDSKDVAVHILEALAYSWDPNKIKASVKDYSWTSVKERIYDCYLEISHVTRFGGL